MTFSLLFPHPSIASFGIRVQSRSCPGDFHDVALMASGEWTCSCQGFTWRDWCAHAEFAVQTLAALKAQEVPA